MSWRAWAEALVARHWWRRDRSALAWALSPLSWILGRLAQSARQAARPEAAPVPVVVVGNLVAGGAGKTPTVIALVRALQERGRRPGVISRGHGREGQSPRAVAAGDAPRDVGDEPLLIARRTGVPVWVGRQRLLAARALCVAHPEVDVLVSDDGLQHHALARQAQLLVFDDRGIGNGLRLPAGPLREPLPAQLPSNTRVLYTGIRVSTPLAGALASRQAAQAWPLAAWRIGQADARVPLWDLRGRRLLACAGLAAPQKFFDMLDEAGLSIDRLPLPDHHPYDTPPWPETGAEVITTEKDAVKIGPELAGSTPIWVVPLDLQLPSELVDCLQALLGPVSQTPSKP